MLVSIINKLINSVFIEVLEIYILERLGDRLLDGLHVRTLYEGMRVRLLFRRHLRVRQEECPAVRLSALPISHQSLLEHVAVLLLHLSFVVEGNGLIRALRMRNLALLLGINLLLLYINLLLLPLDDGVYAQ